MSEEVISDAMSQSYSELDENLLKQTLPPALFCRDLPLGWGLRIEVKHKFSQTPYQRAPVSHWATIYRKIASPYELQRSHLRLARVNTVISILWKAAACMACILKCRFRNENLKPSYLLLCTLVMPPLK